MAPLMVAQPANIGNSPPLRAVEENPNLNMSLNDIMTGAERPQVMKVQDIEDALTGVPDPIRTTVDALDDRSVGRYPIYVQTEMPQTVTYFSQDRFPAGSNADGRNHLEFTPKVTHPYYSNTESLQDDPWRRGNVNKPRSISWSRMVDLITGQAKVAGDTP